ncbi:MAG: hypothetical protein PHQ96_04670 [Candidatus Omnitrophica bacterium]|nr:hypothetical protein [Candidatus Omnitrophota bacterium]
MPDEKKKLKWVKPGLRSLSADFNGVKGWCEPSGSTTSDCGACYDGGDARTYDCNTGTTAGFQCSATGTATFGYCGTGGSAYVGACTSGDTPGNFCSEGGTAGTLCEPGGYTTACCAGTHL